LSQKYVDDFMNAASAGKVFGVSKELAEKIKKRQKR
jgi:hypothetical protein